MPAKIMIISGERGCGKTLLCISLKKALLDLGKGVQGVISPGLYQNGRKIGILAEDIDSGMKKQVASYVPGWDEKNPVKMWKFDYDGIACMNDCIKAMPPADNWIFDEIGILELQEKSGWTAALEKIDERNYLRAYIVVRPVLMEFALKRWPDAFIFNVNSADEPDILLKKLLNHPSDSE